MRIFSHWQSWIRYIDEDGDPYFVHAINRETCWAVQGPWREPTAGTFANQLGCAPRLPAGSLLLASHC